MFIVSQERIDKLITSQGTLTRSQVKKLIKSGLVRVNGETVKKAEEKYETENINIEVCKAPLEFRENIYIMLNKPKGVVSASSDKKQKTVIGLVPDELMRNGLFPAGRLDADTTGFVLITDDGDFAHKILSPKNHIEKTYLATLSNPIKKEEIISLENGIELSDGTLCMRAKLEVIQEGPKTIVEIKICEGKYHQIKRMFAAVGNKVIELERTAIGNLTLDDNLLPGECREIKKEELKLIKDGTIIL